MFKEDAFVQGGRFRDIFFNQPPNVIDERHEGRFTLGGQRTRSWQFDPIDARGQI
jgi:hypothetical protein